MDYQDFVARKLTRQPPTGITGALDILAAVNALAPRCR